MKNSRIVNVSSIAHYSAKEINFENLNSEQNYDKASTYNLVNLLRVMFTMELEKKLREKEMETIGGFIIQTLEKIEEDVFHLETRKKVRDLCDQFPLHSELTNK